MTDLYPTESLKLERLATQTPSPYRTPRSFGESVSAQIDYAIRFGNSAAHRQHRWDYVQSFIDRYEDETGNHLVNPEGIRASEPKAYQYQLDQATKALEAAGMAYPTEDEITAETNKRLADAYYRSRAVLDRPAGIEGTLGDLVGGAVGFFADPLSWPSLIAGGSTGGLVSVAARETIVNALSEGVIQAAAYPHKHAAVPEFDMGEAVNETLVAGLFGGAIGTAGHAVLRGLGVLHAQRQFRDELNVLVAQAQVEATNPLSPTASARVAHAEALKRAEAQVAAGRPVDVRDIVEPYRDPERNLQVAEAHMRSTAEGYEAQLKEFRAARKAKEPESLIPFVKRSGGLKPGSREADEVAAALKDVKVPRGFWSDKGMHPDDMSLHATEAGFMLESDLRQFYDFLADEARGNKVYRLGDEGDFLDNQGFRAGFDQRLNELGLDAAKDHPKRVAAKLAEADFPDLAEAIRARRQIAPGNEKALRAADLNLRALLDEHDLIPSDAPARPTPVTPDGDVLAGEAAAGPPTSGAETAGAGPARPEGWPPRKPGEPGPLEAPRDAQEPSGAPADPTLTDKREAQQALVLDAQRAIEEDDFGDFVIGERQTDAGDTEKVTAKQLLDEADDEIRMVDEIMSCSIGGGAAGGADTRPPPLEDIPF